MRTIRWRTGLATAIWLVSVTGCLAMADDPELELIRPSADGSHFVGDRSGRKFVVWGVNYDHDDAGRLLEDYWHDEWPTVEEDFAEIKALGINVVRIHLQVGEFMNNPWEPNDTALARLARLLALAERNSLYLDVTGLACYHKQDVPPWYDALGEADRWDVQVRFWEAVAGTCAVSDAVFCYNLMNEPILPGADKVETDWLAGAFDGKHFVQRIALDLAGRTRQQVAKAWVDKLVSAIRKHDTRHMITVGVIPWAHEFPGAKPIFYSPPVAARLDFVSVHFYPKKGEVDKALTALAVYEIGKPLVIEEMFPLQCSQEEMDAFIDRSRKIVDGYISFYWGKTIEQYAREEGIRAAVIGRWLQYWRDKGPKVGATRTLSSSRYETGLGHFDCEAYSPLDFLHYLRLKHQELPPGHTGSVTPWPVAPWIKRKHLAALAEYLDSREPCVPVVSMISSRMPTEGSTIGQEAAFLIEGFRKGKYPPALNSDMVDIADVKAWWDIFRTGGTTR